MRAIATFNDVCEKLEPYRVRWAASLAKDSTARFLNLLSLHVWVKRNAYIDRSILDDIARGAPIAGILPRRGH